MEMTIKTGIPQDQVTKIVHEKGPGHVYVETIYPNGLIINYDMLPDGTVNVDCNKPLRLEPDGTYTPIMDWPRMIILSSLKVRLDPSNLMSTALKRLHFIAELSRLFIFPLYGYRFGFMFFSFLNLV